MSYKLTEKIKAISEDEIVNKTRLFSAAFPGMEKIRAYNKAYKIINRGKVFSVHEYKALKPLLLSLKKKIENILDYEKEMVKNGFWLISLLIVFSACSDKIVNIPGGPTKEENKGVRLASLPHNNFSIIDGETYSSLMDRSERQYTLQYSRNPINNGIYKSRIIDRDSISIYIDLKKGEYDFDLHFNRYGVRGEPDTLSCTIQVFQVKNSLERLIYTTDNVIGREYTNKSYTHGLWGLEMYEDTRIRILLTAFPGSYVYLCGLDALPVFKD